MGIRENINRHDKAIVAIGAVVIFLSLLVIAAQFLQGRSSDRHSVIKAFYSVDDGKTWFADNYANVPPFDHDGKQAVRAQVFRCKDGTPFVGYLERYSDAVRARIPAGAPPDSMAMAMIGEPVESKKPGEKKWVASDRAKPGEYLRITTPVCPDGSTDGITPVSPTDSNNGAEN